MASLAATKEIRLDAAVVRRTALNGTETFKSTKCSDCKGFKLKTAAENSNR